MSVVGGRRTFPIHFKLQVLDSYRQDPDCRGNQRATARKYGIHRRQIQKWLQVENILRSSMVTEIDKDGALNLSCKRNKEECDSDSEESSYTYLHCHRREYVNIDCEPKQECDEEVATLKNEQEVSEEKSAYNLTDCQELKALDDYPNMNNTCKIVDFGLGKRRSFSLQFKLEVLNAFYNDGICRGNQRATARKFGINRRQVQKWLHQENELRREAEFSGGLDRQRLGRWLEPEEGYPKSEEEIESNSETEAANLRVMTIVNKVGSGEMIKTTVNSKQPNCEEVLRRKRKSEVLINYVEKRRPGGIRFSGNESESEVENSEHIVCDVEPVQETALCLVTRNREETENRDSVNFAGSQHENNINFHTTDVGTSGKYKCLTETRLGMDGVYYVCSPIVSAKRHIYPLEFKLKALDAYYNDKECKGNQRAVAEKFKVHRRQIQKWLRQESQLRSNTKQLVATAICNIFR